MKKIFRKNSKTGFLLVVSFFFTFFAAAQRPVPQLILQPEFFNSVTAIAAAPNSNMLAVLVTSTDETKGQLSIFDFTQGKAINRMELEKPGRYIHYSPDGKLLLLSYKKGGIDIFDAVSFEKQNTAYPKKISEAVAISPDGKLLLCGSDDSGSPELLLFSFSTGKKIKKLKLPAPAGSFAFAQDNKTLFAGLTGRDAAVKIDIESGNILQTFTHSSGDLQEIRITRVLPVESDKLLITSDNAGNIRWWNTDNGTETGGLKYNHGIIDMIEATDKKRIIACSGADQDNERTMYIIDIEKKEELDYYADWTTKKPLTGLALAPNGNYLFAASDDNTVKIWDKKSYERLFSPWAKIVFTKDGDWLSLDNFGRFEGNNEVVKKIYFQQGETRIQLESVYENFYTPKLLKRLFAGEEFPPLFADMQNLKKAPSVTISVTEDQRNLMVDEDVAVLYSATKQQVTIRVQADCPSDGVTEIRLFQNDKLVETTRNLVVEDEKTAEKSAIKTFVVNLSAGENRFKAIALNTERTESRPALLLVNYKPADNEPPTAAAATLHLVVVGINAYKNPKYNLNYASADATSFSEAITSGSKDLFTKTNTIFIKDAEATKEGMAAAFEKVKATAKPQDLFIFYYAGHGVINDKNQFFLVPHDVTQLYGNDNALEQRGFSANELQQLSKNIKAQKQLFILDACQSAGALNAVVSARGAAEEKAISQLARSTGTYWLTASSSEQFASEFSQLGHGSFTYCLLQAFNGDANPNDKQLTVKMLDAYLQTKVPEVTQKYKGTVQYPVSYSYGNDFPIIMIK